MDDKLQEMRDVDPAVDANWSAKYYTSMANNLLEDYVRMVKVRHSLFMCAMLYLCGGYTQVYVVSALLAFYCVIAMYVIIQNSATPNLV